MIDVLKLVKSIQCAPKKFCSKLLFSKHYLSNILNFIILIKSDHSNIRTPCQTTVIFFQQNYLAKNSTYNFPYFKITGTMLLVTLTGTK
jgi:hypothetical protein